MTIAIYAHDSAQGQRDVARDWMTIRVNPYEFTRAFLKTIYASGGGA